MFLNKLTPDAAGWARVAAEDVRSMLSALKMLSMIRQMAINLNKLEHGQQLRPAGQLTRKLLPIGI